MQVDILSVGSFKNKTHLVALFDYYKERTNTKINLIEIKSSKMEKKKKLNFEKNQIIKNLINYDHIITLDRKGKEIKSEDLAAYFKDKIFDGYKKICFIIGSDIGLDRYFSENYDSISFGRQTWPHLLMRIMLVEQIYRAFEIIKGSSYHK